jgi:hypothetical protein
MKTQVNFYYNSERLSGHVEAYLVGRDDAVLAVVLVHATGKILSVPISDLEVESRRGK